MKELNRETTGLGKPLTERLLQFGGGNFLRGFVDWIIDEYNEKTNSQIGILVVKPTEKGDYQKWRDQEGLYHVLTKGIRDGVVVDECRLISSVSRIIHPYKEWETFLKSAEQEEIEFIISNTTETGIRFNESDLLNDRSPVEFPSKLARWLYHRYNHFKGNPELGCTIMPTELLIDNGALLKKTVLQYAELWQLEKAFKDWLVESNTFCNTLVDRIVPGVNPDDQNVAWQKVGYRDHMITQGEPYHLWAIEAPQKVRSTLPIDQIGLNIIYTEDLTPYRLLKVRILNGTHTTMVPVAYLYGLDTVRESMEDEALQIFLKNAVNDEILRTLDFPKDELVKFATDVTDRFKNPFIEHRLINISLNSFSKFKTRVLPSILDFIEKESKLPKYLTFSLAALIHFYKGKRKEESIPLNDDPEVIAFVQTLWDSYDKSRLTIDQLCHKVLSWTYIWETDLSEIDVLVEGLSKRVEDIQTMGIQKAIKSLIQS